jgi:hypothetical protein
MAVSSRVWLAAKLDHIGCVDDTGSYESLRLPVAVTGGLRYSPSTLPWSEMRGLFPISVELPVKPTVVGSRWNAA